MGYYDNAIAEEARRRLQGQSTSLVRPSDNPTAGDRAGGAFGGAMSGAGTGASIGTAVGGPPGTIVGAILGALGGGIIGGATAKKGSGATAAVPTKDLGTTVTSVLDAGKKTGILGGQ